MSDRAITPYEPPPDGYVWVAVEAGSDWKPLAGKRCRDGGGPGRKACGAPSVAALNRWRNHYSPPYGCSENWWAYCGEHLFGRWIEDGRVMQWILRPRGGES